MKKISLILIAAAALLSGCGSSDQEKSAQAPAASAPITAAPPAVQPELAPVVTTYKPLLTTGITSDPQIGEFEISEMAGRPGHEGLFPVQERPLATGAEYTLVSNIAGEIATASYQMISTTGQTIANVTLNPTPGQYTYIAPIKVPTESFFLQISAEGKNGKTVTWRSAQPIGVVGLKVTILPEKSLLPNGATVPVTINVAALNKSGVYDVKLTLPGGFTADQTMWTANLQQGVNAAFKANVTVPSGLASGSRFNMRASATAQGSTTEKQYAHVKITIE